jgi:DNA-binding response OmpR family regulator
MMEPMDGWETLVAIKQNLETKDIPVMMLTAKQLTPQEAQEYGMYIEDYILKPVTHSELYAAIEGVISRRRQVAEDMTKAREGGFEDALINEYGRLVKSTEITKRLLKLLSSTYDLSDPSMKFSDDINIAIKSMETNMKFQEQRLIQIREIFSGAV